MPTIVKKGTNSSVFKLRNGKKIILAVSPVLNIISDDDFSALMKEYGNFINERRIDDKNPGGCFIIHDEKADATAHDAEIGEEIKDNSAPIEIETEMNSDFSAIEVSDPVLETKSEEVSSEDVEIGEKVKDNSVPVEAVSAAEENDGENKDGSVPTEVPAPVKAAEENKGKRKGKEK